MDLNEDIIKEEVSNFVSSLQKLLPRKKDIIIIESHKPSMTRLSDIHSEAKNVFPKCFIGAKIEILRSMMDKVKLVQQYNVGKPKETYKCYSQLLDKELEPKIIDDGLLVDSTGSATATYKEKIEGDYELRLTSKINDIVSSETEVIIEKEMKDLVASTSCSMRDVDPNTLRLVTQWMYKALPEISIGAELGMKPLAPTVCANYSISAKYERPSFMLTSTVSKIGFQVCLFKQFAPGLRLATILNDNCRGGPNTIGLALHKTFRNGSEFKVFVDTDRCGGFTYQKDVFFHEAHNEVRVLRMMASTLIDRQRRVRFGFGINLDF